MPDDALQPPPGWTLYHSIAFLLVGASCIDGSLDREEALTIRQRMRQYPDIDGDATEVVAKVVPYFERLRTSNLVMKALDLHCRRLAKALPKDALKVVMDDVIAVVGADDALHQQEKGYLAALHKHFGLATPR